MRQLTTSALLAFMAVGLGHSAQAQVVASASYERGPRFLLATATKVVPVDVSKTPVLARRLSLELKGATLKEALAEITSQSGLRLTYSDDVVPLASRVHLQAEAITAAAALTDVLLDAGVDVVFKSDGSAALVKQPPAVVVQNGAIGGSVTAKAGGGPLVGATVVVEGTSRSATTGNDGRYRIAEVAPGTYTVRARYIGYTPGSASVSVSADQEATADFTLEKSPQRLDEVVTTGTVVPTEVKALPTPISVITADEIQAQDLHRVDQIFRGQVPGALAWDRGPLDNLSTLSVRGVSTISDYPTIKTFVDGVELSAPQLLIVDPNSIERIEVTRGPQASTLYGAGALNGVLQIFTKKGQYGLTRPVLTGKVSAGSVGGFDGQSTALQTDNAVSILGGGEKASYNLGGSYRHIGEWVPSYNSTDWGVAAGGQTTQGWLTLSGSARYADKELSVPWDTRFQSYTLFSRPSYYRYHYQLQTYGVTASAQATQNWDHTLTLGYDQTYFTNPQSQPSFTTPADSLLSFTAFNDVKRSLLYHTDLTFRLGAAATAIMTAGLNYEAYEQVFSFTGGATRTTGSLDGSSSVSRTPWTSTGLFSQVQVALANRLFLTGGLRAERNDNFGVGFGTAWSPRAGLAYVFGLGPTMVKLRASYGESIRAPLPNQRDATHDAFSIQLANPGLAPERQRGLDAGIELYAGRASLGVTYYTQRAIDLIDYVNVPSPSDTLPVYQYQNVSRVKNEGWEFESRLPIGPVQLAGTYSIMRSTVQDLPPGYSGDYQVGDRILGVPYASAGITATYSSRTGTTLTGSMTHIGHWINNDIVALYSFYFGGQPYRGSNRAYWIEYPAVTKFALGVSQALGKNVTAFLRAENVGNALRYEADNGVIPMPRSVTLGANVRY